MIQFLLPLLTGGVGSLAGRALLSRLLPTMAGKALPGMAADITGFGAGQLIGDLLLGERAVDQSSNEEAFSRMMSMGQQPVMEDGARYDDALSQLGVSMSQVVPEGVY